MASIGENYTAVQSVVADHAKRAGREPEEVTIVAVSKRQPVEKMCELQESLVADGSVPVFGENYVQEFSEKKNFLQEPFKIHLIGALQSNKAKVAVELFDVIEGVHSEKTLQAVNRAAERIEKKQDLFLQVNISDDSEKSGFEASEVGMIVDSAREALPSVNILGLMTITRSYDNLNDVRLDYRALRELRDSIDPAFGLSMGMSQDYGIAVEEGATMIRVGTAIFGARG